MDISMYLQGFEKLNLADINKRPSLREMRAGRNLSHWIIESADYLQPIKILILSPELFSVLRTWMVFCIIFELCIAPCSQQWWLVYNLQSKKIDYYRRHGIPMPYLRAVGQRLIMNLLHFFSSEQTITVSLLIELIFTILKI